MHMSERSTDELIKIKDLRISIYSEGNSFEVVKGVSLSIHANEIVCLVGESGCGKSTLADLLERHFDPEEGKVLLDGVPMSTLSLKDVRRHVSVVPQDPFIFHASVGDNVRYAAPEATHDSVITAVPAPWSPCLNLLMKISKAVSII